MNTCVNCGHELAGSLFCTQCGTRAPEPGTEPTRRIQRGTGTVEDPDAWRTDTAERPAVPDDATQAMPPLPPAGPPPTAPPASQHPASYSTPTPPPAPFGDGPRYPLYADQIAPEPVADQPARRSWLPWAAGAAVLLLVVVLGFWLMGGNGDQQPTSPDGTAGGPHSSGGAPGGPNDVARQATATVPATAPPNQDLDGNMVRYEARNMLDGVPTTCWRMAGDGTGAELTFDLPRSTTLTAVGLINGYAKTATDARGNTLDWYHGNRRVLAVEWSFDDGTTVSQQLGDTRRMQTLRIDPVTTQSVHLRLVTVSPPGKGRAARDYTPISDVMLTGH